MFSYFGGPKYEIVYNAFMINGLELVRTIQTTDRFDAYEARYRGEKVFAKRAKADKPKELLARVPHNSKIADEMGSKTGFKFRTPKIITHSENMLVTEWIEGRPLSSEISQNINEVAEIMVKFFLVFESQPASGEQVRKTFTRDSLADYMDEKLPKDLTSQQTKLIVEAKRRFDTLQPFLTAAWQDGDIKPDHVFHDREKPDEFVLVDPEHFDPRWPRFYSLANNYVKYWVRYPQELSRAMLKGFMIGCGLTEDEIFYPLLASIIVRCISLHWEPDYDPGAADYNVPRSQDLLKKILAARSLDDLL